ncbi:hypothetical protein SAMN05421823_102694 [Catalinimonas alkaloidigena]|uniref:Chemotaxis phosphatase CheX n=1 Tax=Catalinimonas alkaloidigena TaxID=1075417 RepID=A0A1G9BS11_9BACT|nr:hypothetical protein [Catalinimonas alkaloidigena]SDK42227.1 hypothetical protein SAMN05421823_102694 [Catalinimonas alkaloidigena]
MKNRLNGPDWDIVQQLIRMGLQSAIDAFGSFTAGNAPLHTESVQCNTATLPPYRTQEDIIVLTTAIKGALKGHCHLIFSAPEARQLLAHACPNADPADEIAQAFLLELDNIVTASIVTHFANLLDTHLYGDVPQWTQLTADALAAFVYQDRCPVLFDAQLASSDRQIRPVLVWTMEERFFEALQTLTADEAHTKRISNYISY